MASSTQRAVDERIVVRSKSNPRLRSLAAVAALGMSLGCGSAASDVHGAGSQDLRVNEVVSNNAGVWIDEQGETDDYIEIVNPTAEARDLGQYQLEDASHRVDLPRVTLAPNDRVLLWADKSPEQGKTHIGIKIDAEGEVLTLRRADGGIVDRVEVPALAEHHAFERIPDTTGEFSDCGWATPTKPNGDTCGPAPLPELPETLTFQPYVWPSPFPSQPQPLAITELALRPAAFIEVLNSSDAEVDLTQYALTIAASQVGINWPGIGA